MAARILTVAQQKGGAGKTTLAAQLAVAWRSDGRSVALVDIDPQKSLTMWFRTREERLGTAANGLTLSEVAGWRLSNELDRLRRSVDVVIIDSPPHAETEAKMAIRAADLAVVPLQPSPMDLWATRPTLDIARQERVPAVVVLNRLPPRGKLLDIFRGGLASADLAVAETTLGSRVAFASSMMEGFGVTESDPRSTAAQEIRALCGELDRLLQASA